MINLTEKVVDKELEVSEIVHHGRQTLKILQEIALASRAKGARHTVFRAEELCDELSHAEGVEAALSDLMGIAEGAPLVSNNTADAIGWFDASPAGLKRKQFKRVSKLILFELWRNDRIILPLNFSFGSTIGPDLRNNRGTEVIKFLTRYRASEQEKGLLGSNVEYRVNQHSLRWVYATDWHSFASVSIDDVFSLWDELQRRHEMPTEKMTPPSVNVAVKTWLSRGHLSFCDKIFEERLRERRESSKGKRAETRKNNFKSELPFVHGGARTHGYFSLEETLVGTPWEFSVEAANNWSSLCDEYLEYRVEVKGLESTRNVLNSMYALFDYIGFFLPKFCESRGAELPVIGAPRDFKRYPFVDQANKPLEFPTYVEFLKSRAHTPGSLRSHVQVIESFFDWVAYTYGDVSSKGIAGPDFTNPVRTRYIVKRESKRIGTNKKPFSAQVFPHLKQWLYQVERFATKFVETDESTWNFELRRAYNGHTLSTEDYGNAPKYDYAGETYEISKIPLTLLTGQRELSAGFNLSCLRMFIFTLETGLRVQASQWLDKFSWNSANRSNDQDASMFKLVVNTDKVKLEPWGTYILPSVHELLLRQEQELDRLNIAPQAFKYEGREGSRFDPVTPLFVNRYGGVIDDGAYQKYWQELLFAFSGFAQEAGLNIKPVIALVPESKMVNGRDPGANNFCGFSHCRLKIKPLHTPHSLRSSWVTRRSGAINHAVLGPMIGQQSPATTAHYDFPEHDRIIETLKIGEELTQASSTLRSRSATIRSGPAAIKASAVNSSLQTSFRANREETINRYRIVSLSSALSNADEVGLNLLRNSPTADLVFRDTHICPVGEECPEDVVAASGARMRCGVCKLACKSIDHLPAIAAKIRYHEARIRRNGELFASIRNQGGRDDELNSINQDIEADAFELVGWQQSELVLSEMVGDDTGGILTEEPEIIREHIKRVVRVSDASQFLVERLMDAESYPSMISDELRIKASRISRKLRFEVEGDVQDPDAEIMAVASGIRFRMKVLGIPLQNAGRLIEGLNLVKGPDILPLIGREE